MLVKMIGPEVTNVFPFVNSVNNGLDRICIYCVDMKVSTHQSVGEIYVPVCCLRPVPKRQAIR